MTTRFDHPDYEDTWFTVTEDPTNRDVLMYDSAIEGSSYLSLYPRLWRGVQALVDEWHIDAKITLPENSEDRAIRKLVKKIKAKTLPLTPDIDAVALMESAASNDVISIIKWAGLAVFSYRQSLEPEKNL